MSKSIRSGVYAITHITSGKQYIGSSYDVIARWGKHREQLRGNRHHCNHLQHAWNKYGESEFAFEIIELFPGDKAALCAREQEWLDRYKGDLYNSSPSANPLAALWHESEEGKAAHEEQKKLASEWWSNREYRDMTCEYCGSKFQTRDVKDSRFCSSNCRVYAAIPKYLETRHCEFCHQPFEVSRYRPDRFCSKSCGLHGSHGLVTFEILISILKELASRQTIKDVSKKFGIQEATVRHMSKPKFWKKANIDDSLRSSLESYFSEDASGIRKADSSKRMAKIKSKLTDDQVREIRIRISSGEKFEFIAKDYGTSRATVSFIKSGRVYSYVPVDPIPETIATCQQCGTPVPFNGSQTTSFCSNHCRGLDAYARAKTDMVTSICLQCGKPFEMIKSRPKPCCSRSCSTTYGYAQKRKARNSSTPLLPGFD